MFLYIKNAAAVINLPGGGGTFFISSGLCTILRTAAGGQEDGLFGNLTKASHAYDKAGGVVVDDDDDDDDDDDGGKIVSAAAAAAAHEAYKNNSHWLPRTTTAVGEEDRGGRGGRCGGEESNFVCYYDAASLYPSSGTARP